MKTTLAAAILLVSLPAHAQSLPQDWQNLASYYVNAAIPGGAPDGYYQFGPVRSGDGVWMVCGIVNHDDALGSPTRWKHFETTFEGREPIEIIVSGVNGITKMDVQSACEW